MADAAGQRHGHRDAGVPPIIIIMLPIKEFHQYSIKQLPLTGIVKRRNQLHMQAPCAYQPPKFVKVATSVPASSWQLPVSNHR
jgi:hypothetical protein